MNVETIDLREQSGGIRVTERNARLIALLASFEQGDTEQQRQEFAALQAGVEEARPGQRRVFGEGFNP